MGSKTFAFASIAGVVLLVAAVVAFATGIGPAPGGNGDDIEEFPTATTTATDATSTGPTTDGTAGGSTTSGSTTDGSAGATSTTATATPEPAFGTDVERVETCGQTCRDVTGSVSNVGDADATGVTVYTRIFAGNGTDGDVIWQGKREVGTLAAGESVTATQRVELSYTEALAVQEADGWITVQTTVQSDQKTVTGTERRKVA